MTSDDLKAEILTEVSDMLRESGFAPGMATPSVSATEARVRSIAMHILQGNIDRDELDGLDVGLATDVANAIQRLMALRNTPTLLELEARNPFYSASQSNVIRDRQ